jgi:hypothetical protein
LNRNFPCQAEQLQADDKPTAGLICEVYNARSSSARRYIGERKMPIANETDTSMTGKFIAMVGMSLVAATVSTAALAASKRTDTAAQSQVRQLLRLMDKDKNGTVSKDEFMQYMSQMFDRLDVDRSAQLEPKELRRATSPDSMLCHDLHMC